MPRKAAAKIRFEALINGKSQNITLTELLLNLAPESSKPIRRLYLRDPVEDNAAKSFAEMLKTTTSLEELSISLKSDGASALADALKTNTSLKTLHLWNSCATPAETKVAIAVSLLTTSSLENLNLHIGLGDVGATALAEELKEKRVNLKTLNLQHDGITAAGDGALKTVLATRGAHTIFTSGSDRVSLRELQKMRNAEIKAAREREEREESDKRASAGSVPADVVKCPAAASRVTNRIFGR